MNKNDIWADFKTRKNGFYSKYSIDLHMPTGKDPIEYAIQKAYAPSMLRAVKLNGKSAKAPREKCALWLKDDITKALDISNQKDFDAFAKKCCKKIYEEFHDNEGIEDYTYGNAQKWMSMTFKYLISFEPFKSKPVFDYCYAPIDSIVLRKLSKMGIATDKCKTWSSCNDFEVFKKLNKDLLKCVEDKYPSCLYWEIDNWD